jgi:hypothetical protein
MEKTLLKAADGDLPDVFRCNTITEDALIRRGLAERVFGPKKLSGVHNRPETVIPRGYLGIRLTEAGLAAVAGLAAGRDEPS